MSLGVNAESIVNSRDLSTYSGTENVFKVSRFT